MCVDTLTTNEMWCSTSYRLAPAVPGVVIRKVYTDVRAVKNMVRLSGPPQAQLAVTSGCLIVPR